MPEEPLTTNRPTTTGIGRVPVFETPVSIRPEDQLIINYRFEKDQVANPDGSFKAKTENTLIDEGPGNTILGKFPKCYDFKNNGKVWADLKPTAWNMKKFCVRVLFKTGSKVTARQNLVECGPLPFSLYLTKGGENSDFTVVATVNTREYGWNGPGTLDHANLSKDRWYVADLVFDNDTLAVFIDNRLISLQAFPNGLLAPGAINKLFVGTWTDGSRYPFKGQMAALQIYNGIPNYLEDLLDQRRNSPEWYITHKYAELKKKGINLGSEAGPIQIDRYTASYFQDYANGRIMYHASFGAFEMHGAICKMYQSAPDSLRSQLGQLLSDETATPPAGARKNTFRRGAIYWSPGTPTVAVTDRLYVDYVNLQEGKHAIGLPTAPAVKIAGGEMQLFQKGRMYYHYGAGRAFEVHGAILTHYLNIGGPAKWGFPVSDEKPVKKGTRTIGQVSEFERCHLYWSSATGAHEVHGSILLRYINEGGPAGSLGFPTSDEAPVPGLPPAPPRQYNTLQNGSIVWFAGLNSFVCYPFKLFLNRIKTRDADDDFLWKDDSDIYAWISVKENGKEVYKVRLPSSGTYGNTTEKTVKYTLPVTLIPNQVNKSFEFQVHAWDEDDWARGDDDDLGTYTKVLNIQNAWGMVENNGIYNGVAGSHGLRLDWSAKPNIKINGKSARRYYFWGEANRGTPKITWNQFAAAFRDVTADPNFFDHIGLKTLFYELVIKELAKNGNCFGMSLEGIYARKVLSQFGMPLDRFNWAQLVNEFNIKHQYQVGEDAIWWFVGQFLSGNTHDPKDVFLRSQSAYYSGDHPVICISQNADFSGAPHCVYPYSWDTSRKPWRLWVFDPNDTNNILPMIIDPDRNTFSYNNGKAYAGKEWSGGRLYYFPWNVLNREPHTPIRDLLLLILAGAIIILGDAAETTKLTDEQNQNLDGRKATAADQARLSQMFAPFVGLEAEMNAELFFRKQYGMNNNFRHEIKGKQNGSLQYGIKNLLSEMEMKSSIANNEVNNLEFIRLGGNQPEVKFKAPVDKKMQVIFDNKIGVDQDRFRMTIEQIPVHKASELQMSIKPNFEGIDIITGGQRVESKIKVETMINKVYRKVDFTLPIEGGLRLRPSTILTDKEMKVATIERLHGNLIRSYNLKGN